MPEPSFSPGPQGATAGAPIAPAPRRGGLLDRHLLTRHFRSIGGLTIVVLVAGLAWRAVRYTMGFPIWGDEASLVMTFVAPDSSGALRPADFSRMLHPPFEYGQMAPLLFMWAELAAARMLGFSEWALRLLPFLCGAASLVVFRRFAARVLPRHAALLAVAIMAASFYPVRHGAEVKPYTVDLLMGLALTWLAWSVSRRPESIGRWAALCLLGAAGAWVSYPSAFVAGAAGVYLTWVALRRRSVRALAGIVAYGVVAGGSLLAMVVLYAGPHAAASPWYIPCWQDAFPPPITRPLALLWWLLDVHTGNMLAYPFGGNHFGSIATSLLVAVGCTVLWRMGRRDLLFLLLGPLITTFVAAAMKRYPYGTSARISLYMAPAFCLLAGLGLSAILRRCLPRRIVPEGFRAAAIALAAIAVMALALNVARPYKELADQQNRAAVRELAARTSPSDQWIIANSFGETDQVPFLSGADSVPFRFYVTRLSPAPVRWGPSVHDVAPVGGRTWVLHFTDPKCPNQQDRTRKIESYLRTLTERLGPPRRKTYTLHEPDRKCPPPTIEVYEFPPSS